MPRGVPDDYNVRREYLSTTVLDSAELAVRLSGLASVNRAGNVVYQNNFTCGWGCIIAEAIGVNSGVWLVNYPSLTGGVSAYLKAGSSVDDYARLVIYQRVHPSGTTAIEFAFNCLDENALILVEFTHYDSSYRYDFWLRAGVQDGCIDLYDENGDWIRFGTIKPLFGSLCDFRKLKLVCDLVNFRYVTLYLDDLRVSLEDYNCYVTPSTANPFMFYRVWYIAKQISTTGMYVDDIIITVNEVR